MGFLRETLTVGEAAKIAGVPVRAVHQAMRRRKLAGLAPAEVGQWVSDRVSADSAKRERIRMKLDGWIRLRPKRRRYERKTWTF